METKKFIDILEIYNGKNQKSVENPDGKYPIYGSGGVMGRADEYICPAETVVVGRKGSINNPIFVTEPFWNVDTAFGLVARKEVLLPKYLFYFCRYFDFEKLNTTVTIPSLTKANLLKIEIPIPSIIEQKSIVTKLNLLTDMIQQRQEQLTKLDELIKARFVEMFGEPGAKNENWPQCTLGKACKINPKKSEDIRLQPNLEVSFVPMPAVTENGKMDSSIIKIYDEVKTGFTYFSERDVLFAKITPCMENGKGAVAVNLKNEIGFGSTEFHVIRPIAEKTNPYWIYALTVFEKFRKDAAKNMTGSAGQRRVPASFLENYQISLPPIDLQNQFADFVAEVDKSKVEVQKALDQTQLLFDSLMQQYFG